MNGLKTALCSVQVPSLSQMKSSSYWRGLFTNKASGGDGSGCSHNGEEFFGTFEGRLVTMQEILLWTDPVRSVLWMLLSQSLLYQFCLSSTPLLSSVAYVSLLVYLYHTWTSRVWPSIRVPPDHPEDPEKWTPVHPDTLSAPELKSITSRVQSRILEIHRGLWQLREEKPLVFCILVSSFFICLACLGCRVSAPAVLHSSCLLSFFLPNLLLRLARNESCATVITFTGDILSSLSSLLVYRGSGAVPQEHHDLDEFMPEETAETYQSLEVQDRFQSPLSSEQEDSLSLSLAADLRMPSHEEVVDQLDLFANSQDLELDLLPTARSLQDVPDTDSESEDGGVAGPLGQLRGVEDSSDSDSDLMPQLRTRESPSVSARLSSVGTSVTSMLPSMTSVLGSLINSRERSEEPELEDFELISEDELSGETPDL